jgi:serine/threonine-protein kinase
LKEFILPVHADEEISRKALMAVEHEEAILKQLAAEHIVELYDSFVEDFRAYLVLELIEGQSLRQIVEANGAMEQTKVIKLAIQMCDILAHLHSFKPPIVHRDFTPENLILSHNEMLKLIDFDVARQEDNSHLNQVVGKPSYIAPEQFRGQSIPASDIYSLGASMFFLLTGKEPTPIQASHPRRVVESISEPLDALVAKATASNLQERFTTAEELKRAIEELQS